MKQSMIPARIVRVSALLCALARAPVLAQAQTPAVGATAPEFSLATPAGANVRLSQDLALGSTVLVILRGYPGYQCPFCVKQVHDFAEHSAEFAAKHATVLFVYPGPPADLDAHAREFLAKGESALPANIQLVIDPDYKVTNLYSLRWDAPHETAYPSTFVLDRKGVIRFEKVSHGHGDRTSAADVLAELPAK